MPVSGTTQQIAFPMAGNGTMREPCRAVTDRAGIDDRLRVCPAVVAFRPERMILRLLRCAESSFLRTVISSNRGA